MKRKAPFGVLIVMAVFSGCGALGMFGGNTIPPLEERYKERASLNPRGHCTLLMLDDIWVAAKTMFYRPITNKQLFQGALRGLGKAVERSIDLPDYDKDEKYNAARFWPIMADKRELSDKSLSELCYASVYGLMQALGDPFSYFVDAKTAGSVVDRIAGNGYSGMGFWLWIFTKPEKRVFVEHVLAGSPAEAAGLKQFDEVVAIGGAPVDKMAFQDMLSRLRGKEGSFVDVTVKRRGWERPRALKVGRAFILGKNSFCKMMGDVVYCRLFSFSRDVFKELEKNFKGLSKGKSRKLIIDLRNNGGGMQDSAFEFLSKGWFTGSFVVVTMVKNESVAPVIIGGVKTPFFDGYKTVVLTNNESASASEIVVGALKDYGKAVIVGERTFGKGYVQGMKFSYGAVVFITHTQYLTPNGEIISGKGLAPDIRVELGIKDFEMARDPQLEAAGRYLNR
jgi:carboxyl-terminal processing protease